MRTERHTIDSGPVSGRDDLSSQRGFTLVETLVGLAITAEVLLVALLLFDVNSRLARNQVQVADMQQSQRIAHNDLVRLVRMAGRGGLRQDVAVVVQDDVDPSADAINGNPPIEGSDILTVRGVLNSPMYQINQAAAKYTPPSGSNQTGQILIGSVTPTGIEQKLDVFDQVTASSQFGQAETDALMLVSATSDSIYAVVEITNISFSDVDLNGDGTTDREATISFTASLSGNSNDLSVRLGALNSTPGVFPAALTQTGSVGFAGVVEEYRFYTRNDTTALGGYAPKLSRARFYPNTARIYGEEANSSTTGVANGRIDIAENVLDLQVALGMDLDANGMIDDEDDRADDEWLFNDPDDDLSDFAGNPPLFNLALMTLVRTDRIDRGYQSEPLAELANHVYNESSIPTTPQQRVDRSYRRQLLTTMVDLRNVN